MESSNNYLNNLFGLDRDTIEELTSIFQKNNKIYEVLIFGSRAKGNYSNGSDIDLAIKGVNLTDDDLIDLRFAVDDIGMLYKVDVVFYNEVQNTPLGDHINRVGKIFYKI